MRAGNPEDRVTLLSYIWPDELTVIWHSVFRQYIEAQEWAAIEASILQAVSVDPGRPAVWPAMEPGHDHVTGFALTALTDAPGEERVLAGCRDHGPPVRWRPQPRA